ncbi:VOC family protein [Actinocorallia sp. A-T 12471]|uniref:VOC family protein n=1 Tax=Actinocorallia sp. A-T 12471 TaxID=3089813 RepID=UPI0029CC90C2|nr:VOC family protein [Actinocorallia sp. A-T 12471]MDX6739171.1 VOC family protein [Actinocorallia sp. A-T 12471]
MPPSDGEPGGAPCWIELSAQEPAEALRFYGELFEWRLEYDEVNGYGNFLRGGETAAGLWPEGASGGAASWTVFFAVEDVAATVGLVRDAGGHVVVEPTAVEDYGILAGCLDTEGVFFMLWQKGERGCVELYGQPGSWAWTELFTRDTAGATAFYPRVLGWGQAREGDRVRWTVGGRVVAGMLPIRPEIPPEALSAWLAHFAVPDVAAAAAFAEELGASRIASFEDPTYGPGVALADPQGAQFVLIPTPSATARTRFPTDPG